MSQVEVVSLWAGLIASIAGIVLSATAEETREALRKVGYDPE